MLNNHQIRFRKGSKIGLCLILCMHMVCARSIPTDLSIINKPQTLHITLTKGCPEALLEIRGRYQICDPETHIEIASCHFSSSHPIKATKEGISWGMRVPGFFHLRFVPVDTDTTILLNGVCHKGCLEVHQEGPLLRIITEIDIETYLLSALAAQCQLPTHPAALESLAIVARTRAYYLSEKGCPFDAASLSYSGWTTCPSTLNAAIRTTHGMVLTYKNSPFEALFTQNSVGRTASLAHIFRKNASCPSGISIPALAKSRENSNWAFTVTKQELARIAHLSTVTAAYAFQDTFSGRVYALRLKAENSFEDIDFFSLQKALGSFRLKSNDFHLTCKGERITFSGYGEGHGVGLCLTGAEKLAQQGHSTLHILKTFFPETEVHIKNSH